MRVERVRALRITFQRKWVLAPNKTFLELREMIHNRSVDLFREIQRGLPRGIRVTSRSANSDNGNGDSGGCATSDCYVAGLPKVARSGDKRIDYLHAASKEIR
jgi:hypothetical protein